MLICIFCLINLLCLFVNKSIHVYIFGSPGAAMVSSLNILAVVQLLNTEACNLIYLPLNVVVAGLNPLHSNM